MVDSSDCRETQHFYSDWVSFFYLILHLFESRATTGWDGLIFMHGLLHVFLGTRSVFCRKAF